MTQNQRTAILYSSDQEEDNSDDDDDANSSSNDNDHHVASVTSLLVGRDEERGVVASSNTKRQTPERRVDAFVDFLGGWIPAALVDEKKTRIAAAAAAAVATHDDNAVGKIRVVPLGSSSQEEQNPWLASRIAQPGTRAFQKGERPCVGQVVDVLDITPTCADWLVGVVVSVVEERVTIRTLGGEIVRVPQYSARIRTFGSDTASVLSGMTSTIGRNVQPITTTKSQSQELQRVYSELLASTELKLRVLRMEGDGNCLFRSVSHQLYGSPLSHDIIRRACADYIQIERAHFEPFIEGDKFDDYVETARTNATWGDNPEIQALAEVYDIPVEVFSLDVVSRPPRLVVRKFSSTVTSSSSLSSSQSQGKMLRLSFFLGGHYDSLEGMDVKNPVLLHSNPGVVERRALEIAKIRAAGGEALGKAASDRLATEQVELEEAIRLSKQVPGLQAPVVVEEASLQDALAESLRVAEEEESRRLAALLVPEDDTDDVMLRMAIQESLNSSSI